MGFSAFKNNSELENELASLSPKMGEQKDFWRFQQLLYRVKFCSFDAQIGKSREWNSRLTQQIEDTEKTSGIIENK